MKIQLELAELKKKKKIGTYLFNLHFEAHIGRPKNNVPPNLKGELGTKKVSL